MPLRWINLFVCGGIGLVLLALFLPPLEQGRNAARKAQSNLMLRNIGLSLENYHDIFRHLPPGSTTDAEGRGLHGWMTLTLPYLEQSPTYHRIDLELPWDHWSNRHLFRTEIPACLNPNFETRGTTEGYGLIHFAANPDLLHRNSSVSWSEIPQGRSHCWMLGEAQGDFLPWGAPFNWRRWDGTLCESSTGYGVPAQDGANILFADGSVKFISRKSSVPQFQDFSGGLSPASPNVTQKPEVHFDLVNQVPKRMMKAFGRSSPTSERLASVLLLYGPNGEVDTADFTYPASKVGEDSLPNGDQLRIALQDADAVRIIITNSPLDPELCSALSESPSLECLAVSDLNLPPESFPVLARLPRLKAIKASKASVETLAQLKRQFPGVEFLVRETSETSSSVSPNSPE